MAAVVVTSGFGFAARAFRFAPAVLAVVATDGDRTVVWVEREGQPAQSITADPASLPPGPVALRIVRHASAQALRTDIVWLTLEAGRQHLVAVGDAPLPSGAPVRYPAPGVVPAEARQAAPPPASTPENERWLRAADHVLLIVNPYAEAMECRVEGEGWTHALALPGPVCRVMAIGASRHLRVVTRLMPGGEPIEERQFDGGDGLSLYTVGGATIYRWFGATAGTMPILPSDALTRFPANLQMRLPDAQDPGLALLFAKDGDLHAGLTTIVSDMPVIRGAPGPLVVRAGITVSELQPPSPIADVPIASLATDGITLIAIGRGGAYDFVSGRRLHESSPIEVARAIASPAGLVLLTRGGALAGIREQRLVVGAPLHDPTLLMAPAGNTPPAVWLYGGQDQRLAWQPLDGTPPVRLGLSGPDEAQAAVVTALAPTGDAPLMARGRRIDRLMPQGPHQFSLQPVLILPEAGPDIIAVIDCAGRLVFATPAGVYALQGDLVVPLVEGLGGPLLAWREGLLVHDARTHRVYQLTGPALAAFANPAPVSPGSAP